VSATADPPPVQVASQRPESLTYGWVIRASCGKHSYTTDLKCTIATA